MAIAEVILKENIPGLGAEADIVKVRRGYARNFLVPTGKAYEVTPATLRQINNLKAKRAEREARELNDAEEIARRINKLKITMVLETGETGQTFGSISVKDIQDKLKEELGREIEKHRIQLDKSIKETGEHEVPIKLHHDVIAKLKLVAKPSVEPQATEEGSEAAEAKPKAKKAK